MRFFTTFPFALLAAGSAASAWSIPRAIEARSVLATNLSALPTTMNAPLVVTISVEPSPTQTDAAVASAYASYQQACGPTLAQALQNALVAYNERAGPITDLDNQGFQAWAQENFGTYGTALSGCMNANLALAAITDSQSASASSTLTSTSTTGAASSSIDTKSTPVPNQTQNKPTSATPPGSSSAPSPSATKGCLHK
ncbi:hypothetical protein DFH06DRAFT_1471408 [Mycena polygramma]|nr:hypothetical protein DFH06DRAFT_1471408 [Mycena polygramma]